MRLTEAQVLGYRTCPVGKHGLERGELQEISTLFEREIGTLGFDKAMANSIMRESILKKKRSVVLVGGREVKIEEEDDISCDGTVITDMQWFGEAKVEVPYSQVSVVYIDRYYLTDRHSGRRCEPKKDLTT